MTTNGGSSALMPSLWVPRVSGSGAKSSVGDYVERLTHMNRLTVIAGQNGSGRDFLLAELIRDLGHSSAINNKKLHVIFASDIEDVTKITKGIKGKPVDALRPEEFLIVFRPKAHLKHTTLKDAFTRLYRTLAVDKVKIEDDPGEFHYENNKIDDPRINVVVVANVALDAQVGKASQQKATYVKSVDQIKSMLDEVVAAVEATIAHDETGRVTTIIDDEGDVVDVVPVNGPIHRESYNLIDLTHFDKESLGRLIDKFFGKENSLSDDVLTDLYLKTGKGRSDYVFSIMKELKTRVDFAYDSLDFGYAISDRYEYRTTVFTGDVSAPELLSALERGAKTLASGFFDHNAMSSALHEAAHELAGPEGKLYKPCDVLVQKAYEVWHDTFVRDAAMAVNPKPAPTNATVR